LHPELLRIHLGGPFGDHPINSYGVMIILGVAVGISISVRRAGRYGIPRFDELAVGLLAFGGGIAGAVGLYVLVHLREFVADPALFKSPGLVFYGGLAGGALAAFRYCRAYGISLARAADAGAPGLALGHAMGRVGCLLGGCCYGRAASDAWPFAVELWGERRHAVQLYEAAGLVAISALTALLGPRLRARPSALFIVYLGAYAGLRIVTEGFRGDDLERGRLLGLSTSQLLAAVALVAAAFLLTRLKRKELVDGG
jgi:phosphatidylglycerol---prolipoprotein diacylglyceryl transferase